MGQDMWQQFVRGLAATGIFAVDPTTFKASSGLAIADWEVINFTGLGPVTGNGAPIPAHIFNMADPMPNEAATLYVPGPSFADAYAMFLEALLVVSADSATITLARTRLGQYKMADAAGQQWPGYGITPGLNDFLVASLQSVGKALPNQIDFSLPAQFVAGSAAGRSMRLSAIPMAIDEPPFFGVDRVPMNLVQPTTAGPEPVGLMSNNMRPLSDFAPSSTTIRFQARAAQMFSVQPGRWFSATVLSMFHDRLDPASSLAGKPLFGPGGWLNGRASQVLVAFRRVVTVSGPQAVVAGMKVAVGNAAHAFNVGSFHFATTGSQTDVKATDPGTIVFQDNTNAPYVIGIGTEVFHAPA